jgi:hypothetical protein
MRNRTYVIAALAGGLLLAGCASSGSSSPVVPTVNQASSGAAAGQGTDNQGAGSGRAAALHAAAECIRQHGIPSYSDPVLTSGGQVYSDSRSIGDAPDATINAVQHACLNPGTEPPAPPQLVEAGVRGAECMRAHGLPNVQDPTAQTPYIPGHGFSMTSSEIPAGGKASPVYQRAAHACRSLLDAEIRASTLASLGNDG